jgi:hypothetical protein
MNREAMWQLGSSPYDVSYSSPLLFNIELTPSPPLAPVIQTTGEWYAYHGKLNAIRRAAATYSLNFYSNLVRFPSPSSPFFAQSSETHTGHFYSPLLLLS